MRKLGLIIVFFITAMLTAQCTEDDTIERAEYEAVNMVEDGGEEADDKDSTKDE